MRYVSIILLVIICSVAVQAQSSFFGITYDVSIPTGDTEKYVNGVQWRGFGLEGRWYTSKNITLGFAWDWNVFHESSLETAELETGAVTGNQNRTINAFPFLFTAHYYLKGGSFVQPYFGIGAGTYLVKKRLDVGIFTLEEEKWHFGLAPEIGFLFPMDLGFNLQVKLRYNYVIKNGDAEAESYLGINVGFASIELF